jgi:tyrosine-protein kinase Etk/Wzc
MAESPRQDQETGGEPQQRTILQGTLDALIVLAKRKRLVLGLPAFVALVAALISVLLPNEFTATARILPPQQSQSAASAMLGQLGGLAMVGGAPMLGLKSSSDIYVGMLKSRTVLDGLVQRFDLRKVYDEKTVTAARLELVRRSSVTAGKDGIIALEVKDRDPQRAADLTNGYVDELYKLKQTLAITEASQRRLFFEKQLMLAKNNLAAAEVALKQTQQATGLVRLDDQGRAIIENVARLRAQISAKEVQLSAMRTFATADNPDYLRVQEEVAELQGQLARAQKNKSADNGIFVPTGKIAESGLEYVRKLREVKYHETMFELMAKQLELARVDEARDGSVLQVIDGAVRPEEKSGPRRVAIVVLSGILAFFAALLIAFALEALERSRQNPGERRRLDQLLGYLHIWRRIEADRSNK